jgi:ATP-dependent HslUV protease ATP-binding subunit HslU
MAKVRTRAEDAAEDRMLDILLPPARDFGFTPRRETPKDDSTRQTFRKRLREGELDDKEIEIELAEAGPQMEIMAPPGMEEMTEQIKSCSPASAPSARKRARSRSRKP